MKSVLDLPENETIEIVERNAPDGRRFIFILNCTNRAQFAALPAPMQNIWNQEQVKAGWG